MLDFAGNYSLTPITLQRIMTVKGGRILAEKRSSVQGKPCYLYFS
jgi:hypothetical protein